MVGEVEISLAFLPVAYAVLFVLGLLLAWLLSQVLQQVKTRLPIICNGAAFAPGYYLFAVLLASAATVKVLILIAQHIRVVAVADALRFAGALSSEGETSVWATSVLALVLGCVSAASLAVMAVVSFRKAPLAHNVVAVVYIASGILYQAFFTAATFLIEVSELRATDFSTLVRFFRCLLFSNCVCVF